MTTASAQVCHVWPDAAPAPAVEFDVAACPDGELAARAAGGDVGAFAEVYRRHNRRVHSLCLRMLKNAEEAEDLTHDVFVHLFRKIGSFRGEATFTTWLHRLTVNHVLMHFRKHKHWKERTAEDDEDSHARVIENLEAAADSTPSPDLIALDLAVAKLPPGYRAVFVLHDVEGYEHEEIAAMLGVATGTSKSQLHKARTKLRKLLKAHTLAGRPRAG
jgi:RNA polymerase sigma-70 factor (ECF subfamily)